jgi:H+/gluconate symporter-like permease
MAGIVLALVLLIVLAYRGVSVLVLVPLCALVAVLFSPGAPLFASYTQVFMKALGGFVIAFFPLFLLGAVFGKLMEASGAALSIAQAIVRWLGAERAVLAVVAACAVLTYGGVSLFVVAFAVYPIAAALFQQAQVPKRLMPAAIALGAFTFTMTALPGTPAIQNAIPMPFFGTTPFAARGLGLIGAAVMLVGGWAWIARRSVAARRAGEGYGDGEGQGGGDTARPDGHRAAEAPEPRGAPRTDAHAAPAASPVLSLRMAIAPVVLVIALNYVLSSWLWPALDST